MAHNNRLYHVCARDARHFGGTHTWLVFRCLPAALLGALLMLLLSASASAAASLGEAGTLDEVQGGQLLLREQGGGTYAPALIHASRVHFDISGMIATVTVEQAFRNDGSGYLEGIYAFPLPDRAAVRYLEMRVGERRIVGKVREKAEAKKIYTEAKRAGKKASLVEQQRPNLFTNRVANIGPGEQVVVQLEYVQPVAYQAGAFSLRFPMTITPRYMPGSLAAGSGDDEEVLQLNPYHGWAAPTDQVPDADAISPLLNPAAGSDHAPINPIEISAELDMGMPLASVESPYHDIALSRRAGVYNIELASGVSEMDRDFVLTWEPVTGASPRAALFTEKVGAEYYGLLMVVPPSVAPANLAIAREMIFVVDTSGSMGGVSIQQARASVSRALEQLRPQDRFNIIEFNSHHRALYRNAMPATRHHVQQAQEFVRLLSASGGTEMLPALRAALASGAAEDLHRDGTALRQVIFITDGAVGNEAALFEELSRLIGETRLFTVGIGSAPNSWFMRKAAQYGRGTHTHIGDINEVGEKMAVLFEQLSRPAAVNMAVTWPTPVEAWPERMPDLYAGEPLSLAVQFGAEVPVGEVRVGAEVDGKPWTTRLSLADDATARPGVGHQGVASLWARRKIEGLLDRRVSGVDEATVRAQVLPLALEHQLLSPYTSFVAVEEVVTRPAGAELDDRAVPNTRPRGQSPQAFAYPRTATTGPAKLWFGMLAMFLSLMLRILRQPEVDHAPAA